jgi:hypothetical protein
MEVAMETRRVVVSALGRQLTVAVPFSSFSDVTVSVTPMAVPPRGTIRLDGAKQAGLRGLEWPRC